MRNILRLFFTADGINPWTVLLCLLTASVIEGLGFASLVPLLMVATDSGVEEPSPLLDVTRDVMATVGLPLEVGPLIIFFVATLVVKSALNFLAMQYVSRAIADFSSGLRSRLIQTLFRANWAYLVQHPVGRIANSISGQAARAGGAYQVAATFLAQSIQTVAYLVVAFVVSWPIALAATGISGLMVLALHFLVRIARKAGWRQTQRSRDLVTLLMDSLNNIKPLKAMAKEDEYAGFLEHRINLLKKAIRRQAVSQDALKNGNEALVTIFLGIGFFLALAVWQVPLIELAVIGVLIKRTSNGIGKLQQLFQQAVASETPYLEAMDMMAEAESARELNPGRRQASFERECRLEGVSFAHGERPILESVSLQIPAGGVTVLIGLSGAGKTTIADLILGLYRPSRGRVTVDGVPLDEIDLKSWRRLIGYVPQDLVLFHDTIQANVALGDPQIGEAEVPRPADGRRLGIHRGAARRPAHPCRPERRQAVGRRAAADRSGACPGVPPEAAGARRGDERARSPHRAADLRQCPLARRRGHGAGDHPPSGAARHRRPLLPGRGRPGRGDRGARAARAGAAGLMPGQCFLALNSDFTCFAAGSQSRRRSGRRRRATSVFTPRRPCAAMPNGLLILDDVLP